ADTASNRARLARIHYVLTTWNELDPAVAEEIRSELDDISGEAGGTTTMVASLFQHVPAARLARMLGVGGNRAARGILSQYGAGGSLPRGSLAFSGGIMIGAVHVHDARGFKNELQKLQRGQPSNRRGARERSRPAESRSRSATGLLSGHRPGRTSTTRPRPGSPPGRSTAAAATNSTAPTPPPPASRSTTRTASSTRPTRPAPTRARSIRCCRPGS